MGDLPEPEHATPTAFICEIVADQLQCKNPQTQEEVSVVIDDIVCIRPISGNGQHGYSILYLDKNDGQQPGNPAHITRVKTASLPPTLLSRYLWEELPAHLASTVGQELRVHVIVSTYSGTGTAKSIYQDALRPFLSYLGLAGYELHETRSAETIKELVQSTFLPCAQVGIRQTIILLSGDGGLIDIIDTFYNSTESVTIPPCIALVPTGTGNAMANSVGLRHPIMGLGALLRGTPKGIPVFVAGFSPGAQYVTEEGRGRVPICSLPLARNQEQKVYGAVVASWGFHAALVADSDTAEYRKFGADRFKLAATELLSPSDGSPTHSYRGVVTLSKPTKASESQGQMKPMKRDEHMYALVTLVSRLEQEFVISPDSLPLDGCLRLVHFGPQPPDEAMQLMTKAYQGGLHVHEEAVTYTEVDRFRIDFREKEERWRRVCVDGKIIAVEPDGWTEVRREPRRLVDLVAAAQTLDRGYSLPTSQRPLKFHSLTGWHSDAADTIQDARMLLSYQAGSVRVGEAVRYTISYTPAADPIYPPPEKLYVKVRNTSAAPLRAAYLHGPYTLYAACYPSTFDPNVKYDQQDTDGVPQFEPYVKAGGSWDATITVPQRIRATPTELAAADPESRQSVTWIIEILSQVVFSDTATVNFEVLVGRDEKSAQLSSTGGLSGHGLPQPAQLQEHWSSKSPGEQILATAGVYSKSITLLVDDTTSLWNSPPFPSVDKAQHAESCSRGSVEGQPAMPQDDEPKEKRKKKVHLVILTHGLHSNLGADMLYLKESIDISAKRAKEQAKQHQQTFSSGKCKNGSAGAHSKSADANDDAKEEDVEEDDEQVIVRGFFGNAVRTERGIQYLGKRLAKYVLLMTYPDQSYSPLKSSKDKHLSSQLAALKPTTEHPKSSSSTSDPHEQESDPENHAYQISSISFIGHSLGGLIQTYAIAYIQKYSPQFFDLIEPINFIALATPFLGLSNENPVYVRFALDLGLVGRTGQDLGLSWTAPKVRSGWGAMIGGRGEAVNPQEHSDPGSKPLLRILPCGPAHEVLAKFQHRTIYSNVVNDGIVPLRTSSLLFLDWKGLDRVEKARRDNGLVGTMAEWGWAELTGANSKSPLSARSVPGDIFAENRNSDNTVPSTSSSQRRNNNEYHGEAPHIPEEGQLLRQSHDSKTRAMSFDPKYNGHSSPRSSSPWASFLSLFRPKDAKPTISHKQSKIFKRGQTVHTDHLDGSEPSSIRLQDPEAPVHRNSQEENWSHAPPKTTFLESASDLLMPPLPPAEFLLDPASRPRTIFHDRIYHPEDIPAPLPAKRRTLALGSAQNKPTKAQAVPSAEHQPHVLSHNGKDEPESGLRVEEKIARAYHRDLTWRKVLVRLEPDAHNNIIVRRMFTNAYGWPVVKHLVDTHFGHTSAAQSTDFWGTGVERAKSPMTKTTRSGNEVTGQTDPPAQEVSIDGKQENLPEGAADCKRDTDLPRSDLQKRPDTNEPSDHIQTSTKPSSGKESHTETPGLPDSVRQIDPNLANDDEHGDNDGVRGQQQLSEGNTGETASRQ